MNDNILCSVVIHLIYIERSLTMQTIEERTKKNIEILTKEIETLNSTEMHDLVLFYYKINHQHFNLTSYDKFKDFLEAFDKNPFRINDDKAFKKQLTENLISFTVDYVSLITAVMLIKRNFTVEEIIEQLENRRREAEKLRDVAVADGKEKIDLELNGYKKLRLE